jgi:hypothetical protein
MHIPGAGRTAIRNMIDYGRSLSFGFTIKTTEQDQRQEENNKKIAGVSDFATSR